MGLIGSISKSFIALGVLKAVDKGLLALDDAINKHLSWFKARRAFSKRLHIGGSPIQIPA